MKKLLIALSVSAMAFLPSSALAQWWNPLELVDFCVDVVCETAGSTVEVIGRTGAVVGGTILTGGATIWSEAGREFCAEQFGEIAEEASELCGEIAEDFDDSYGSDEKPDSSTTQPAP